MTRITADTTAIAMTMFAGQTVTMDELTALVEQQYALGGKRTGITSFFKVFDACEAAGATSRYTGPNYTGQCLYTFPSIDLDR
jgi:dTDP-4-amino-4,6-dideoxygalactose transaminase